MLIVRKDQPCNLLMLIAKQSYTRNQVHVTIYRKSSLLEDILIRGINCVLSIKDPIRILASITLQPNQVTTNRVLLYIPSYTYRLQSSIIDTPSFSSSTIGQIEAKFKEKRYSSDISSLSKSLSIGDYSIVLVEKYRVDSPRTYDSTIELNSATSALRGQRIARSTKREGSPTTCYNTIGRQTYWISSSTNIQQSKCSSGQTKPCIAGLYNRSCNHYTNSQFSRSTP